MDPRVERAVRAFVGLSLLAGAFLILAGAIQYGTFTGSPSWVFLLAGTVAILLVLFTVIAEKGPRSAMEPAALWIASVLAAMLWAHLDPTGHSFLSGYASLVAFATGIGILRRELWAWPVALASVVGFGPIVLLIAPLPAATVAGGFVLFLLDAFGLLAIHRVYFEPRR
ncbi:MAG: hypothetical protein ACREDF_00095 [Thermoplasmata archaeon]